MNRIVPVSVLAMVSVLALSCGGNSSLNDDGAVVYLTAEIGLYNPDISVCFPGEVTIAELTIRSESKDPTGTLTANQDVILTRWVVTPYRTDGGTATSPQWSHDVDVFVPAGGQADLQNYRVYPAEYLSQPPLSYLLPENGGFDPETGNRNIRQSLRVEIFGRTVSGKSISVRPFTVAFNFTGC